VGRAGNTDVENAIAALVVSLVCFPAAIGYSTVVETGAFAMFDALGIRGVWATHKADDVLQKFESIAAGGRNLVDGEFGGVGHPNTRKSDNFVKSVRLGFVSDTVVIGFVNKEEQHPVFAVMMAARYAGEIARLGLNGPVPWAYRGVITYGRFAIHESGSFFVGPAVDEAAANYERVDAAMTWLAPSASGVMNRATDSEFQGAVTRELHEIPLKDDGTSPAHHQGHVASPFPMASTPAEAASIAAALLDTFDLSKPGVQEKYLNTKVFLKRHLKEHGAIWQAQQTLLSKFYR
jgi:hypothetical protein